VSSPGSRRDHDRFCQVEPWSEARNARGKKVGYHVTYELELPDGRILRTRVSRPANNNTYGANLWNLILTEQLCVSEKEFWECVSEANPPKRGFASDETPAAALPAQLVHQLIHDVGVPEGEIVGMTLEVRDRTNDRVLVPASGLGRRRGHFATCSPEPGRDASAKNTVSSTLSMASTW
jgi:hypothetical protein